MGAAHPAMNPYNHPDNAGCRRSYSKDMCARSLDILNRTVMVPTNPSHSAEEIDAIIHNIEIASRVALAGMSREEAEVLPTSALDVQKFDMGSVYESDLGDGVGGAIAVPTRHRHALDLRRVGNAPAFTHPTTGASHPEARASRSPPPELLFPLPDPRAESAYSSVRMPNSGLTA
jgi:hypothetical protein